MTDDFYSEFEFQSSLNLDECLKRRGKIAKKKKDKVPTSKSVMAEFIPMDDNNLIHQSTNVLWRISEDGGSVEPLYDDTILEDEEGEG